jgi:hypothetical protein
MRSASSSRRSWLTRSARVSQLALTLCAAVVLGSAQGPSVQPLLTPDPSSYRGNAVLDSEAASRLERSAWVGGTYTTGGGEAIRVHVSDSYPTPSAVGQRWADYLGDLVHGSELSLVTVYVVTPEEIQLFCGLHALGCYGGNELVFMGETVNGVTPEEVAAHEYGHHVAANRLNPPWLALDWGPKRWASAASICARESRNEVHPEDHDANYRLHPGEGFAEVYRVLNESRTGATTFGWPIVDLSFYPGADQLRAAEQDVVTPWTSSVSREWRARFASTRTRAWSRRVATPLDGLLDVLVRFPRGAQHELTVLAGDRTTVLARGLWSGPAEKHVTTTVCGERSVVVRVTRRGPPGRFTLRVTHD